MKANLRKKNLLPLSRATWSVLHGRHYFHNHRHRPQNSKPTIKEVQFSVHNNRLSSAYSSIVPNICTLAEQSSLSLHKPNRSGLRFVRIAPFSKRSHHPQLQSIIECSNQYSAFNQTTRYSHDPGTRGQISISHLQLSSHRSERATSRKRVRYMRDKSQYAIGRSGIDASRPRYSFVQLMTRVGINSIPYAWRLEQNVLSLDN